LWALLAGGLVVALGWTCLQLKGRPVVGVNGAVAADTPARRRPPFLENVLHAVLQIVAVGSGAPIGREVAPGEVGELLARGPQVFSGYWDNPEESAEVLLDGGWLRTGDLVRQEADGFYVIADRRKELIISGGFNIYPTEVEAAVRSMPQVEEVAVVGLPAEAGNESVVAAILPKEGQTVTLEQVREWAAKNLSNYALPRQIAILTEMPRSQIGKVLRRVVRDELLAAREAASGALDAADLALVVGVGDLVDDDGQGVGQLVAHALQGAVDDPLGSGLLAVQQNAVDELGDDRRAVDGVDDERTLGCGTLTRHYFFSFLAPYLERACWRPLTPWVSRAPRTMW